MYFKKTKIPQSGFNNQLLLVYRLKKSIGVFYNLFIHSTNDVLLINVIILIEIYSWLYLLLNCFINNIDKHNIN